MAIYTVQSRALYEHKRIDQVVEEANNDMFKSSNLLIL